MKWYGEEVKNKFELATLSGLVAASITLEGEIVKNIQNMNIIDTGRYMGSITYRAYKSRSYAKNPDDAVQSIPEKFESLIGTNVVYAAHLEFGHHAGKTFVPPRPAIRRAFDESKQKIQNVFVAQAKKMLK